MKMRLRCPACASYFLADLEGPREDRRFVPFCSERCRAIDLGCWLDEEHRMVEPLGLEGEAAGWG